MGFQTDCVTTGEDRQRFHGSIPPPIYESSLFVSPTYEAFREAAFSDSGRDTGSYVYSRRRNPTVEVLEHKIALLEGAEAACAFGSGMAAIVAAILHAAGAGAHIVAVRSIYNTAHRLLTGYLPRLGIEASFVDCTDLSAIETAITSNTRVLYLESPGNPTMDLVDLNAVSRLAHERGLVTILDNSMASPYNQRPLEHGIDLVVHSASKYLSGHSDVVAGVVAGSAARLQAIADREFHDLGGIIGPFEAWLILRGIRTLGLRMRTHNESGLAVATWLQQQPEIQRVFYAGLPTHPQYHLACSQMSGSSGMVSIVLSGGMTRATRFVDALALFGIGVSWGGFESLALPIDPEHSLSPEINRVIGVVPGFVRLSVGLEDVDDLVSDLESGLQEAYRAQDG
jgi:methionine-gamma-lyase